MILYFSGTGNTKYVAELLSAELNDNNVVNILPMIKAGKPVTFDSASPFIICLPSYIMDIPLFVKDFLQNVTLKGNDSVYSVMTCGSESGISYNTIKEVVESKGKTYKGNCDVILANNYVINTRFGSTPDEEVLFRLKEAKLVVKRIALFVKHNHSFKIKKVKPTKKFFIKTVVSIYTSTSQPSTLFNVSDKCIGCGKCASLCPVNKIHLDGNKHPVWEKSCMHCMSCIGNCPVEAIGYGDITKSKTIYNVNKFLDKE